MGREFSLASEAVAFAKHLAADIRCLETAVRPTLAIEVVAETAERIRSRAGFCLSKLDVRRRGNLPGRRQPPINFPPRRVVQIGDAVLDGVVAAAASCERGQNEAAQSPPGLRREPCSSRLLLGPWRDCEPREHERRPIELQDIFVVQLADARANPGFGTVPDLISNIPAEPAMNCAVSSAREQNEIRLGCDDGPPRARTQAARVPRAGAHSTLHGVVFVFLCLDACGVPLKGICTASGTRDR